MQPQRNISILKTSGLSLQAPLVMQERKGLALDPGVYEALMLKAGLCACTFL